jgi:hypothetical protein
MPARSDPTTTSPEAGATVVTIDEKRLGTVTTCESNHFHIRRRWGRGFWLSCNIIRSHEPGRTILNISNETVPRYKRDHPSTASHTLPSHQPMSGVRRLATPASRMEPRRARVENRWMLAFGAITILTFGLLAAA